MVLRHLLYKEYYAEVFRFHNVVCVQSLDILLDFAWKDAFERGIYTTSP